MAFNSRETWFYIVSDDIFRGALYFFFFFFSHLYLSASDPSWQLSFPNLALQHTDTQKSNIAGPSQLHGACSSQSMITDGELRPVHTEFIYLHFCLEVFKGFIQQTFSFPAEWDWVRNPLMTL